MGLTEREDLSPPRALRDAINDLDIRGGTERLPTGLASGRILAERVDAPIDVPGFDRAAMDGYAVRASDTDGASTDTPRDLTLVDRIRAGEPPDVALGPGDAAEITTGAVVPQDADAVVIVERTTERDGTVAVRDSVDPGDNVTPAGADVAAGSRAIGPGTRLSPREIGLLSALGRSEVEVRARPAVGVVPTGAELVDPGDEVTHEIGEIYDVNSHTIAAAVREAGGHPTVYPHVGDDTDVLENALLRAAEECDLVLSSGSTSAGAGDVVRSVVEAEGDLRIHGVAVKPGKPTLVGRLGSSGYVGLPGYPVSALSIFRVFVAPAIRSAAGFGEPESATIEATMALAERFSQRRHRYVPVGIVTTGGGETLAYPVDKGSGATTSLAYADGVVEMPADVEALDAGTSVTVDLFSSDAVSPSLLGVGEDGPVLSRLLDQIEGARYLSRGSHEGVRLLGEDVPDVAVVSGPTGSDTAVGPETDAESAELGGWYREWGIVVPSGNPEAVTGLGDLVDRELMFVNRGTNSGLRASLDAAIADLAAERGAARRDLTAAIDGFDRAVPGVESPARRVEDWRADAGLGLRATAERLGLGFVRLGEERVTVFANPDRTGKSGTSAMAEAVRSADGIVDGLPGVSVD